MRNFKGSVMMFALAMASMGTGLFKRSSLSEDKYQVPNFHGGGGHGGTSRKTNKHDKRLINRRRKEKAARKARRKK